jgi:hypothetical protein
MRGRHKHGQASTDGQARTGKYRQARTGKHGRHKHGRASMDGQALKEIRSFLNKMSEKQFP